MPAELDKTKSGGAIAQPNLADRELQLEAEAQRYEIELGLRNPDGSIPPEPEHPNLQSEERRPGLNPKTAHYGEELAKWLNTAGGPEHHRVCKIIDNIKAVEARPTEYYWPTFAVVGGRSFSGRMPTLIETGDPEYERQMSRLRNQFRAYTFSPNLHYPLERQWVGSWEPIGKRTTRTRFHLGEHDAVRLLYEIVTDGEFERLRQCDCGCSIWFFAGRLDRRFYGEHRQEQYRKSPEFKKHRAEWMAKHRRVQKDLDKKAKIAARDVLKESPGSSR